MNDILYEGAIQGLEQLDVGIVEKVSHSGIEVVLNSDAPHNLALNTGTPTVFPRINSHLLIPNEHGYLVGSVSSLDIVKDNTNLNTHKGKREDILGIPPSKRKLYLVPLGILKGTRKQQEGSSGKNVYHIEYRMERGTITFPTIGDAVHIPTRRQLESILSASEEKDKRVSIGSLADDPSIDITVDPDKIFGRHLAVLGNTGSGKSCTVAGLIRWSIEAAKEAAAKEEVSKEEVSKEEVSKEEVAKEEVAKEEVAKEINANFIILDVNGEYSKAFRDYGDKVRILNADQEFAEKNSENVENI
ncbi:MAG: ATP-binding protein, partial [Endozoicomonadaceae bacterium]|nr:ATP-binding protein [Endozoicomonadaceae bacterium]